MKIEDSIRLAHMEDIAAMKLSAITGRGTKKDFIEPLFRALGWNIEDSDEVKAEEKVSKKRVDYAFRIDGINKFFLEAKALKEYTSDVISTPTLTGEY